MILFQIVCFDQSGGFLYCLVSSHQKKGKKATIRLIIRVFLFTMKTSKGDEKKIQTKTHGVGLVEAWREWGGYCRSSPANGRSLV